MVDLARAPETLQGDLDLLTYRALLRRRPHVVLAPDKQFVDLAVNLEDSGAFGFGGMRGEHRFHAHAIKTLGDLLVGVGLAGEHVGADDRHPLAVDVDVGLDWSEGRLSAAAKDGEILKAAANPRGMQGYAIGR